MADVKKPAIAPEPIEAAFWEYIHRRAAQTGVQDYQLAERIGFSKQRMSDIFNGKSKTRMAEAIRAAEALNVPFIAAWSEAERILASRHTDPREGGGFVQANDIE